MMRRPVPHSHGRVVDLGMQSERTHLSWSRTALSLAAIGGLLFHAGQARVLPFGEVPGIFLVACAAVVYLLGHRRYRHVVAAVREHRTVTSSLPLLLTSVFATLAALLALILLLV